MENKRFLDLKYYLNDISSKRYRDNGYPQVVRVSTAIELLDALEKSQKECEVYKAYLEAANEVIREFKSSRGCVSTIRKTASMGKYTPKKAAK